MWKKIGQRLRDMGTIKDLCLAAGEHAHQAGHQVPAAEHLLLASWDLRDGTARKVFERWQVDPERLRSAIDQQYQDALRHIGIEVPEHVSVGAPLAHPSKLEPLYGMQASGQALMQRLYEQHKRSGPGVPLLGAHVVIAAALAPAHGLLLRSFQTLGLDPAALVEAAEAEIRSVIAQGASG